MPTQKNFKRRVRSRMAQTGERYTIARAKLETRASGRSESDERLTADGVSRVVCAIFAAQRSDGTWGDGVPGRKYTGTFHVLTLLAKLGVDGDDRLLAPLAGVLDWLRESREKKAVVVDGRLRWHVGAYEGAILDAMCAFGMAADPRAAELVEFILSAQWPDGGWNCDRRPSARSSSFVETFEATRGLFAYAAATGDRRAHDAAVASTDVFLRRGIIRSERSGALISGRITQLHWPRGYDLLWALEAIAPGGLHDPRLGEALDLLESKRRRDGTWRANGPKPRVASSGPGEIADVASIRDEMATRRALAVLGAAGRLPAGRLPAGRREAPKRTSPVRVRRSRADTIRGLLADAGIDESPASVEPVEGLLKDEDGTHSRVVLADGRTMLLREYDTTMHGTGKMQAKESFLFAQLGRAGLPVPSVLASVGGSVGAGGDAAAMLLSDADGEPLESVLERGRDGRSAGVWRAVGALLKNLHEVPIERAGVLADPRYQLDAKREVTAFSKTLNGFARRQPKTRPVVERLLGERRRLRAYLSGPDRRVAICHGDGYHYPTGILLARDGSSWSTTGWLIWGQYAAVGDPMHDVCVLERKCLERTGELPPPAFYRAYGTRRPDAVERLVYGFRPAHSPEAVANWRKTDAAPWLSSSGIESFAGRADEAIAML